KDGKPLHLECELNLLIDAPFYEVIPIIKVGFLFEENFPYVSIERDAFPSDLFIKMPKNIEADSSYREKIIILEDYESLKYLVDFLLDQINIKNPGINELTDIFMKIRAEKVLSLW